MRGGAVVAGSDQGRVDGGEGHRTQVYAGVWVWFTSTQDGVDKGAVVAISLRSPLVWGKKLTFYIAAMVVRPRYIYSFPAVTLPWYLTYTVTESRTAERRLS